MKTDVNSKNFDPNKLSINDWSNISIYRKLN